MFHPNSQPILGSSSFLVSHVGFFGSSEATESYPLTVTLNTRSPRFSVGGCLGVVRNTEKLTPRKRVNSSVVVEVLSETDGAQIYYAVVLAVSVDMVYHQVVSDFVFAPEPRESMRHVTGSVYPDLYVAFALSAASYTPSGASRAAADFPSEYSEPFVVVEQLL